MEIGIESCDDIPRLAYNRANLEQARRGLKCVSKTRSVMEVEL